MCASVKHKLYNLTSQMKDALAAVGVRTDREVCIGILSQVLRKMNGAVSGGLKYLHLVSVF